MPRRRSRIYGFNYFLIMLGGALGSGARFWASGAVAERIGATFPFGTLLVNISGCFVIGFLAGLSDPQGQFLIAARWRLFLMVGLCGGYTTFSAFSLQTLDLAADGDWLRAGFNAAGSFSRLHDGGLARPGARQFALAAITKAMDKNLPKDAVLLRILLGESDRWKHQPLYEAIVLKARELHLAGATVLRGPMGFGASSRIHSSKILRLSMDLPIVIEIVDVEEKVSTLLPVLEEMMGGGLVTMEKVKVIHYRQGEARPR